MAKLVTLYKSEGGKFDEKYLVATDWSLVRNPPPNYPPTAHPHVKADITDFAHTHDDKTTFINLTGQLQKVPYRRLVIALCELTSDNPHFNSYSIGTLTFHRLNGLQSAVKFDFAIEKRYNTAGYNISFLTLAGHDFLNGITPCIFTYNGVKYGGVEVYFSPAELSYVSFYGTTNFNIFGLDYFDTQNATALISEVNNSLNYDPSLIQIYEEISINKKKVILESDSRLSDSRNAKDVYSWAKATNKPSYSFSEIGNRPTTISGYGITDAYTQYDVNTRLANKADLVGGKVPANQLPSFVDDVLEFAGDANFPTTGETGKIYTDTNTNKVYRWSGSDYVEISASLALGETSSTAYAGNKGKTNADNIANIINGTITVGNATKLNGRGANEYVLDTELSAVLSDYYMGTTIDNTFVAKSVYEIHKHDSLYAAKVHSHPEYLGVTAAARNTEQVAGRTVVYVTQSEFTNPSYSKIEGYHYVVYEG